MTAEEKAIEELGNEEEYWKRYQDSQDIEIECERYDGLTDYERNL